MKLYLLRHGKRGYGEEQDTLMPEGIKQAKKTAEYLVSLGIDKVICGSSNRTRKTAEPFLKKFKGKIEFTSDVNEQSLGVLEGKSGKEWKEAIEKSGLNEEEFRPKGGENREDVYNRAKKFWEKLKKEKYDKILVISHSGFISDLCTIILKEPKENNKLYKSENCAITFFEFDENFNVINYCINDTSHLS